MAVQRLLLLFIVNLMPFYLCIAMDQETQSPPRTATPVIEEDKQEEVFAPNQFLSIVHGAYATQGIRSSMEDCSFPEQNKSSLITDGIHFFGVYDGHGGRKAAQFACNFLHQTILTERGMGHLTEKAIINGHKKTDSSFIKNILRNESGTTTVTAFFEEATLWIANAGDSEAVACFDGINAQCVTQCHKPDQENEQARILSLGGTIRLFNDGSVQIITNQGATFPQEANLPNVLARNREKQLNKFLDSYSLDGAQRIIDKFFTVAQIKHNGYNLATSRGVGDFFSKPFCIPDPFVQSFQLTQPGFIILACDGLWDTISYQAAVNFVLRELVLNELSIDQVTGEDAHRIAQKLVEKALEIWNHDNVTATIVFFSPIR